MGRVLSSLSSGKLDCYVIDYGWCDTLGERAMCVNINDLAAPVTSLCTTMFSFIPIISELQCRMGIMCYVDVLLLRAGITLGDGI